MQNSVPNLAKSLLLLGVYLMTFVSLSKVANAQIALVPAPNDSCTRAKVDVSQVAIKFDGPTFKIEVLNFFKVESGNKTLQVMGEKAQFLYIRFLQSTALYNQCIINKDEYIAALNLPHDLGAMDKLQAKTYSLKDEINILKDNNLTRQEIKVQSERVISELNTVKAGIELVNAEFKKFSNEMETSLQIQIHQLRAAQRDEQAKLFQQLSRENLSIESKLDDTKAKLENLSKDIDVLYETAYQLERRMENLEGKVNQLMEAFFKGEIDRTKIFLGIGPLFPRLKGKFRLGGVLSAEVLYPKFSNTLIGVAPILEVGGILWKDNSSYLTFPGSPEISLQQENNIFFSDIGLKKYFNVSDHVNVYFGAAGGFSKEFESGGATSPLFNMITGVELYRSNVKTALEFRYVNYGVSENKVQFNPLGEAMSQRKTLRYGGISLGVLFSILAW